MFVITLSEIIGLVIGGTVLLVILIAGIKQGVKEGLCKHDKGVSETRACDAICRKCGKNLGFIGTWRKQNGGNR